MMTWEQFDARLTVIEDQTAARQERVDGYRDQQTAKLFVESEYSQQELAEHLNRRWKKDVTQQWVSYHLRFGRFLSFFTTTGCKDQFKLPPNLTERAFRGLWEATKGEGDFRGHRANTEAAAADEQRRFGEVLQELQAAGLKRRPKPVRTAIIARLAGKNAWLSVAEIRDLIAGDFGTSLTERDVYTCLDKWRPRPEEPYRLERCTAGSPTKFRLVKIKGTVPSRKQLARWGVELIPMLDRLIREAQKPRVDVSLTALCELAGKIRRVVEAAGLADVPADD